MRPSAKAKSTAKRPPETRAEITTVPVIKPKVDCMPRETNSGSSGSPAGAGFGVESSYPIARSTQGSPKTLA